MGTPLEQGAVQIGQRQPSKQPITVLLVDDARAFADAACRSLEREDGAIETLVATSGEDALRVAATRSVDCVVSDYRMPDMDGLALHEELAAEHPDAAFILITGTGDESLASRAIQAGVDDYVPKTPGPEALVGLARRVRASLQRQGRDDIYREAWRDVPVGLSVHDPETGAFLDANARTCEILGFDRPDLLDGASKRPHPTAKRDAVQRLRDLVRATPDDEAETVEWVEEAPDGSRRWIEASIRPVPIAGQPRMVASLRDVTERREREEAIREIYEIIAGPDDDFEGKVRELMRLGREVLGIGFATLSRIEGEDYVFEHVQSPSDEIQAGDVVSIHETLCEETVIHEGSLVVDDALEARNRTRGKALQLSCYIGVPVSAGEDVHGTFCFYDVQPRKEPFSAWEVSLVDLMGNWVSGEMERLRVQEALERENQRLEDFASMVSHDLRSPLAVAAGHAELLRDGHEDASPEPILSALDRARAIIDDALTWARTGDAVEATEPVSLGKAAQASWDLLEPGDARLVVDARATVEADEVRLSRLLENLFRNALEHAGDDVTVTVGDLDHGFYVEDDGPGLPEGAAEEVFEAGYSTASEGTGFGLAIVEQIADAHGWTVRATRGDGGGARFEVGDVERVPGGPC